MPSIDVAAITVASNAAAMGGTLGKRTIVGAHGQAIGPGLGRLQHNWLISLEIPYHRPVLPYSRQG